jgi:IclR family pca regulon transcriptional regulator
LPKLNAEDSARREERVLADGANPADFSEALARGFSVLLAFSAERREMTLAEVAREVGLSRATVRRSLTTLVHLGYLELRGRQYTLTVRVLELASAYLAASPMGVVVQPLCERLCRETDLACSAAVLDGEYAVMIARAAPHQVFYHGAGVGFRLPVWHTALGRAALSALPDDELRARLRAVKLTAATEHSVMDKKELLRLVAAVRDDGYAYVVQEADTVIHSIAVPLRRWDGQIIGSVNAGARIGAMDSATMTGPVLERLRTAVREAAPLLL